MTGLRRLWHFVLAIRLYTGMWRNSQFGRRLRRILEYSVGVKRIQTACSPRSRDVPLSERLVPGGAIERGKVLLPNCIRASPKQSLNLVAIGCLQGRKDSDIIGLELVGGVRGETAKDNVVLKAVL